jgi:hypothetical protein
MLHVKHCDSPHTLCLSVIALLPHATVAVNVFVTRPADIDRDLHWFILPVMLV